MHRRSSFPGRWLAILLLALLCSGMGGGMRLCLLPDGGVHMEEAHGHCDLADGAGMAEEEYTAVGLEKGDGPCTDINVALDASTPKNIPPPLTLSFFPRKLLPPFDPTPASSPAADRPDHSPTSSQLLALQGVILRI